MIYSAFLHALDTYNLIGWVAYSLKDLKDFQEHVTIRDFALCADIRTESLC